MMTANQELTVQTLKDDIQRHIALTLGSDPYPPRKDRYYLGLCRSVRDRLLAKWLETQRGYYDSITKRVYYMSLEFLPGRFLMNYIQALGIEEECRQAVRDFGFDLDDLEEEEWNPGLGNGGLGRLASCYLDSMATCKIPGYGYGILYDYGIFYQTIVNGYQQECADNWLRQDSPWVLKRGHFMSKVSFYGRSEVYFDSAGQERFRWVDTEAVMAMACDVMVPGYQNGNVVNMRLWKAISSRDFELEQFNQGDYIGAVQAKVETENISKVLYPNDHSPHGKELRLKQQYFFVAATFQDILRRFRKNNYSSFDCFPSQVTVQLNDTHPAISIAELMRLLIDEESLSWDTAWTICQQTFAYTNHTVLPEALETWSADLLGHILPRHMQIIFEINHHFLEDVRHRFPGRVDLVRGLSIIGEGHPKTVRMAHLAIVGSHTVNGVAALHSQIIKTKLFRDFNLLYSDKFTNVTNGVTPRRWLFQCNPALSNLISSVIGPNWVTNLEELQGLVPYAQDLEFQKKWQRVRRLNKKLLARYVLRKLGLGINPSTLFDVHVKRIHEYKRQLLNILHVVTLYNRIRQQPGVSFTPRTVFFAGKAAPGYFQAKLIIKLINSVAQVVNADPQVSGMLNVVFLPNYCVSQAEKIIPATDLSEQISTAGMEASGTGNMKFAINGALTIGTLDGANVEIRQAVGEENFFLFGHTEEEVERLRSNGYNPWQLYEESVELRKVLDMIATGYFSPEAPDLFKPIVDALLPQGDYYMVLADYEHYVDTQFAVSEAYADTEQWTRMSILNTARMGYFSSDRSVLDYAQNIWKVAPLL
ncbi:MAG: glycogen/starch/alpha-glucan phosphorylase [Desulfomicrobium sp.]|jgi:starch phosphorylase|nr:glycogen/starch/alpha-glucan phosphorylase [Desulfomicrobium sp.]NLV97099.1 glycogen/starch/alpha-glucan phosphorylase [Desulfovibrionales bacterium]